MTEAALSGLFGLLIGSFLNVCIYRLPRDLSVVHPRSFCPGCERPIAWYDNVPLLSYILLAGRCRHCRIRISPRYPVVELLTGFLFTAGVLTFGFSPEAAKFCVFAALQIALVVTDLEERILPDAFTLGGVLVGIAFASFVPPSAAVLGLLLTVQLDEQIVGPLEAAGSAAFLSGLLWTIGALYHRIRGREGLGLGDVKLVGCIGAFLGLGPSLLVLAGGSVLGSVAGIAFIIAARKDAATYELPFGSFLGIAAIAVALLRPAPFVL